MNILWAQAVNDDWGEIKAELNRAFRMSRACAVAEENIVYVVHHDEELVRGWAERMAEQSFGVTGELIRLGSTHLGKALP